MTNEKPWRYNVLIDGLWGTLSRFTQERTTVLMQATGDTSREAGAAAVANAQLFGVRVPHAISRQSQEPLHRWLIGEPTFVEAWAVGQASPLARSVPAEQPADGDGSVRARGGA
jgi:hypothetical protein